MLDRPTRIKNLILSPGISLILAVVAFCAMLPGNWPAAILSIPVCGLMVSNIKARALFRGPNFPFAAIFMALQAATAASLTGTAMALCLSLALTALYLCFQRPDMTRTLFLIFLCCGFGALWMRGFLFLAVALEIAVVLLRAFSLRGFTASLLGLITPLIILGGFGVVTPADLAATYSTPMIPGVNVRWLLPAAVGLLFGILTFLPSYGYPAKARARNMAMLGLTFCALPLPCIDSLNCADYLPLLNLCAAYNVCHFAASRSFGWVGALAAVGAAAACFFLI